MTFVIDRGPRKCQTKEKTLIKLEEKRFFKRPHAETFTFRTATRHHRLSLNGLLRNVPGRETLTFSHGISGGNRRVKNNGQCRKL